MVRSRWAAVLVSASLLTGCASAPPMTPEAIASAVVAPAASGAFNGTDVAWIQLMVPMTAQMTPLLTLAADRAADPDLRDLAATLRAEHLAEDGELRGLLARTGLGDTNPHEGHDMPGMVTPAEVTALEGATGDAFDEGFVTCLRDYLTQTAMVSGSEGVSGTDPATKELAGRIAAARRTHLMTLDGLRPSP